jgi:hypothetical protein
VTTKKEEGVAVRVFNAAKTALDCFKYGNKTGLEVTLDRTASFGYICAQIAAKLRPPAWCLPDENARTRPARVF